MNTDDIVVGIVALSGGELVGRTRLQKTAFLLDRCGMRSGVDFEYHHYGPYCSELAAGWDEARSGDRLEMESRLGRYGIPYTIFRTNVPEPRSIGSLDARRAKGLLARLNGCSDVDLELAATILYLREQGYGERQAIEEVKVRKPLKATPGRLERAARLLGELGIG